MIPPQIHVFKRLKQSSPMTPLSVMLCVYKMEIGLSQSGLDIYSDCLEQGTARVRRLPALFNAGDVASLVDSTDEMQALLDISVEEGTEVGQLQRYEVGGPGPAPTAAQ
ncbi:hypothetical protein MTO96_041912 [Rhipicephalus appendiculatus]